MAPFTITEICFPNLTLHTLSLSFLFCLLLYLPHLSFPLLLPVGFRFWEASRETLLISEWRMPFLTCWHHVFPLTFSNDLIFGKLIPRQQLLIYRAPTIGLVYPEEFERMVGVANWNVGTVECWLVRSISQTNTEVDLSLFDMVLANRNGVGNRRKRGEGT